MLHGSSGAHSLATRWMRPFCLMPAARFSRPLVAFCCKLGSPGRPCSYAGLARLHPAPPSPALGWRFIFFCCAIFGNRSQDDEEALARVLAGHPYYLSYRLDRIVTRAEYLKQLGRLRPEAPTGWLACSGERFAGTERRGWDGYWVQESRCHGAELTASARAMCGMQVAPRREAQATSGAGSAH